MGWRLNAEVKRVLARLPAPLSREAHYRIQRHLGGLRALDPTPGVEAAVMAWDRIWRAGREARDKVFFEVGTGWYPAAPLAYWLMGARGTVTLDATRYLRPELIVECVRQFARHEPGVRDLLGARLLEERWTELIRAGSRGGRGAGARILAGSGVSYVAPADAAATGLDAASVDFHTSIRVFEHVPEEGLRRMLVEGRRVLRRGGLFVHRIDYTDHFAHGDRSISRVHFLRYDDERWGRLAGNPYAYTNRLRHDDFLRLLRDAGHRLVLEEPDRDERILELARRGSLPLHDRFRGRSPEVIATTGAWLLSEPAEGG